MASAKSYLAGRTTATGYYNRFLNNDLKQSSVMLIPATTTDRYYSTTADASNEFDESDIWNLSIQSDTTELKRQPQVSRFARKSPSISSLSSKARSRVVVGGTPSSLPVNVPDWSRILRDEYKENRRTDFDYVVEDDEEVSGGEDESLFSVGGSTIVPPHELLARKTIALCSVHEGIGRTLKGRDLSRVRNAIWQKIGFED